MVREGQSGHAHVDTIVGGPKKITQMQNVLVIADQGVLHAACPKLARALPHLHELRGGPRSGLLLPAAAWYSPIFCVRFPRVARKTHTNESKVPLCRRRKAPNA